MHYRRWAIVGVLGLLWLAGLMAAPDEPMAIHPARPNNVAFEAHPARFVRIHIRACSASQPCIDELEVYGPDSPDNLALAAKGAVASASSCLPGFPIHQIRHLNDGLYGNRHSWIAATPAGEWAQIELPAPARIDAVVFSRDREGQYRDRVPTAFDIQTSADGREWRTVKRVDGVSVAGPEAKLVLPHRATSLDFAAQEAKFVRVSITRTNTGAEPCIDELEVYGADPDRNLAIGAKPSASSCIVGYAIHKVENLNDGQLTNDHSWIAGKLPAWAQVELAEPAVIRRVALSRDRGGKFRDRVPYEFEVALSTDGRNWSTVKQIVALENVRLDTAMPGETPEDWAWRVAAEIPAKLRVSAEALLARVKTMADVQPILDLYRLHQRRTIMLQRLSLEFNPAALRRAVADLRASFPGRYRPPAGFEGKLAAYARQIPGLTRALSEGDPAQVRKALQACEGCLGFQRSVLLANPLLSFREVLLLQRQLPAQESADTYWQWGQKYGMPVNWSSDFRPKNPTVAPWWDDSLVALSLPPRYGLRRVDPAMRARTEQRPYTRHDPVGAAAPSRPAAARHHSSGAGLRAGPGRFRTVFQPKPGHMLQHPDLSYDGKRLLIAMPDDQAAFQVWEMSVDGTGLRRITRDTEPDIDNGDACYLPDGRIVFNSTRLFTGVPCEDGFSTVSNLCLTDAGGKSTRLLTFDQESNWYPTVLNNGRVLYTRYEYANVSHQFGRLLFHMNPDGTEQAEYYGSNSYWPNSIFYARPVPNHPTKVVGVVCGHHGPNRTGRLVLFDPARGRHETSGAIQTLPGWGKPVQRIVADELYAGDWPKFVHPWPLSDKYFLVSARLHPEQPEYALYLVDVFDNVTEICRLPGASLLEPIPLAPRPRPPIIPDRVRPGAGDATVFLSDVYEGKGLQGVPRGTVKGLRLFTYNFVYRDMGTIGFGHLATPGVDGPWEPRYLLGTVPVRPDGSALFTVPANTPISVQPLDAEGRALQVMRSWFTAMPGEGVSCVGCHETRNAAPVRPLARPASSTPDAITPWRGPARGFDYELEVQPVLDRYCVGCHDGGDGPPGPPNSGRTQIAGPSSPPNSGGTATARPDLSRKSEEEKLRINRRYHEATESTVVTTLTPSYIALHPYVRRPNAESNYGVQTAAEFLADTSPLVQMLKKGHHNVRLDAEAWDRLVTWIDLGAPDQGSWKYSEWGVPANYYERRLEILRRFANRTDDVEWLPPAPKGVPAFVPPSDLASRVFGGPGTSAPPVFGGLGTSAPPVFGGLGGPSLAPPECPGWPFNAAEARRRQEAAGLPKSLALPVPGGPAMELALVPAGEFVMGEPDGPADERPVGRVAIPKPFYLSRCEVTNAQFAALVDPRHFSGHVSWFSIDWRGEGYPLFGGKQPVVHVSWLQAMHFCKALAAKTGRKVRLPTEAEWEWACRAGSASPLWYGGLDDDFSAVENLAGRELRGLAFDGKPKWFLRDDRFDDRALVTTDVGSYRPNPWGLHDMAGNAAEWTLSTYRPYPYAPGGRNSLSPEGEKAIRGGSWYDKPNRARSAFRWKYPAWMKPHNVGFRVLVEAQ